MARNGWTRVSEDEIVEHVSPARARAELARELAAWRATGGAGPGDEQSIEAEAGALLEAETAAEIHDICGMIRGYIEAMGKR